MSRIFGRSSAAARSPRVEPTQKPSPAPGELTKERSGPPDYLETSNGFRGGPNYDRKFFCRRLFQVLCQEEKGFIHPNKILQKLWDEYGIDGNEVAMRNGYILFERLLKSPDFADVVSYEPVTHPDENGVKWQYTFVYTASMESKVYEDLRRLRIRRE